MLAHNGEINTLSGNVNWMMSHEIRMASDAFGPHAEEIKPVITAGSSDSAALDAVFEMLVHAGRSAPLAKLVLIPESWSNQTAMPESHRALYSYCNCIMEPWDGPAAVAATDGRWVIAGMDRNGLRPLRYTITDDGLVFVGSEAGMVPLAEAHILKKGRVGPGEIIGVDLRQGRFYHDREIKDELAAAHPYGEWVQNITPAHDLPRPPGRRRLHDRGRRDDPATNGRRWERSDRLDGRRYPTRGPHLALSRPASFLPPEIQPGDEPPHRFAARKAGDVAQDSPR
jgi:glutamate synthase (NADPH/NADH) large chain